MCLLCGIYKCGIYKGCHWSVKRQGILEFVREIWNSADHTLIG